MDLVAYIRSKLPADPSEDRGLSPDLRHELWAVSAQKRIEIVRKLKGGLQNDLIKVFKYVTDWSQAMNQHGEKKAQIFVVGDQRRCARRERVRKAEHHRRQYQMR